MLSHLGVPQRVGFTLIRYFHKTHACHQILMQCKYCKQLLSLSLPRIKIGKRSASLILTHLFLHILNKQLGIDVSLYDMEDQLYWLSAIACSYLSLATNKLFNNILLTLLQRKHFYMVIYQTHCFLF